MSDEEKEVKLTYKQKAFIQEYLLDFNATQAAIRAGYSDKWTNTNASKLLQNTTIREAIDEVINLAIRHTSGQPGNGTLVKRYMSVTDGRHAFAFAAAQRLKRDTSHVGGENAVSMCRGSSALPMSEASVPAV